MRLTDRYRGQDWPDLPESVSFSADSDIAADERFIIDVTSGAGRSRHSGVYRLGVTRPNDILVTTNHPRGVIAVVDERGGYVPVATVECLRVDNTQLDPHYVAYCLNGRWNTRFSRGSDQRADIRELEVPVLPMAEQRLVVAALHYTHDLSRKASATAYAARRVADAALDVVRYGAAVDDQSSTGTRPEENHG
jgi:hypothetical protein